MNYVDMVTVEAPAKLNLSLDIAGTRPDGYHELRMVMQTVGLCDTITLSPALGWVRLTCDDPTLPTDERNLAYRAAQMFLRALGLQNGVDINIQKRIPSSSGLGGGSSDAAAVLRGLDLLLGARMTDHDLFSMAEQLGSDVPFCLTGGTQLAMGRGTLLEPLPPLHGWAVVAKPPVDVPTEWAYRAYDECLAVVRPPDTEAMLQAVEHSDLNGVIRSLGNVLELITATQYPVVSEYVEKFTAAGAAKAIMSGSGSAVFTLTANAHEAQMIAARLAASHIDAHVCELLDSVPPTHKTRARRDGQQ